LIQINAKEIFMKKIIVITGLLLVSAAPVFAASLDYAATNAGKTLNATAPASALIGKTSKGVVLCGAYSSTGYALASYHTQGTKEFGTAYDATAIYVKDVGTTATITAPTSSKATDAGAFGGAGWSAM
jgi:ABC-type xylose transport system permease subunit